MVFTRIEKDGIAAYTDGTQVLKIASDTVCRERLIRLLEEAEGNAQHVTVYRFWQDRAKEIGSADELRSAWAAEYFQRLSKVWDELVTPPPATQEPAEDTEDAFSGFGI